MGKCPTCGQTEHFHDEPNWPDPFDIPDEFDFGPPPGVWRTKEGEWIAYEELEDSHLLNIVAMLERKFKPDGLFAGIFGLSELKAEVARRSL